MQTSLSIVISDLNTARKPQGTDGGGGGIDEESPLESITMILNSHLSALEWVERATGKLEERVERLKREQSVIAGRPFRYFNSSYSSNFSYLLDDCRSCWF